MQLLVTYVKPFLRCSLQLAGYVLGWGLFVWLLSIADVLRLNIVIRGWTKYYKNYEAHDITISVQSKFRFQVKYPCCKTWVCARVKPYSLGVWGDSERFPTIGIQLFQVSGIFQHFRKRTYFRGVHTCTPTCVHTRICTHVDMHVLFEWLSYSDHQVGHSWMFVSNPKATSRLYNMSFTCIQSLNLCWDSSGCTKSNYQNCTVD